MTEQPTEQPSGQSSGHKRHKHWDRKVVVHRGGGSGAVYFFGLIGAAIYYIQAAEGFWPGVLGLLKAFIWPVFVVYDLLKHLNG